MSQAAAAAAAAAQDQGQGQAQTQAYAQQHDAQGQVQGQAEQAAASAPLTAAVDLWPVLSATPTAKEALECLEVILKRVQTLGKPLPEDVNLPGCVALLARIEPFQAEIGYTAYLNTMVPTLIGMLKLAPTSSLQTSPRHVLRKDLLALVQRLPSSEHLRNHLADILTTVTELLESGNEEISSMCLTILIEKYRAFRPAAPHLVQRFIAYVKLMYSNYKYLVSCRYLSNSDQLGRLKTQHVELLQKSETTVADCVKALKDMEARYSVMHAEYERLQSDANGMTVEQKELQARLTEMGQQQRSLPPTEMAAASAAYMQLQTETATKTTALNENIQQQQTKHAALTQFKTQYMESQALQKNCEADVWLLKAELAWIEGHPNEVVLSQGSHSLKILAESRNILIFLLQLYKDLLKPCVEEFLPLMIVALAVVPAEANQTEEMKKSPAYMDYMSAQVKTMWFVSFCVSRNFGDLVSPQADNLATRVMYMLETMPPCAITVRKELLMATRQLLTLKTFRIGFMHHLDKLMTGDLLVGPEWTSKESLKPLAYSTLADLLHHIREQMSLEQLTAAVNVQLNNIVDNTLPLQLQTMCCKLLMNLVQALAGNPSAHEAVRHQLVRILEVFVNKLRSLRSVQFERVLVSTKRKQAAADGAEEAVADGGPVPMEEDGAQAKDPVDGPIVCTELDTQRFLLPIPTNQISVAYNDGIKDCRFLLKNIISGLKVLFWGIQQSATTAAARSGGAATAATGARRILRGEETILLHGLLHNGLACFDIYAVTLDGAWRELKTLDTKCSTDEKEAIETFANIFASLHPALFTEIFNAGMPDLVNAMVANNLLLAFPQIILSTKAVSTGFASNLLEYLLKNLHLLGQGPLDECQVYLRLFKLVFGSVNLFAEVNEKILQPHLTTLMHRSMELSTVASEPDNYFLLLRALFRSIGGGKKSFEELYKEFLPLLPSLLNGLNRLQERAHKKAVKGLFVELCLTVPVRLSALLPYLHLLMRPLVLALESGDDLVSQGLRTLELFVDNLSPLYLAPIIEPVKVDLMKALWDHMQSRASSGVSSSLHGVIAFRLLGKLGGRNRDTFIHPPVLTPSSHKAPALRLALSYDKAQTQTVYLAIDEAVSVAVNTLRTDKTVHHLESAFRFLRGAVAGMLNLEHIPSGTQKKIFPPQLFQFVRFQPYYVPQSRKGGHRDALRHILEGFFIAASKPALAAHAQPHLASMVEHCTLLSALLSLHEHSKEAPRQLDPEIIVEALCTAIADEDQAVVDVAVPMMQRSWDVCLEVFAGNEDLACRIPLWSALAHHMSSSCYERNWYHKKAGCMGIRFMMNALPQSWLLVNHLKFNKALLFCVMDLSDHIGMGIGSDARTLLLDLQQKCFGDGLNIDALRKQAALDGAKSAGTSDSRAPSGLAVRGGAAAATSSPSNAGPETKSPGTDATPMDIEGAAAAAPDGDKPKGPQSTYGSAATTHASRASSRTAESEFLKLVKVLAAELLSPDDTIRDLVKRCLAQLSKFSTVPLTDLLKNTSMKHVALPKSTRNSPIHVQIGRMDAMIYCLTLEPPLTKLTIAKVDDESTGAGSSRDARGTSNRNYVREVLEICKLSDEQARAAGSRPSVPVNPKGLITLRRKAIELVAAVIVDDAWAEFRKPALEYFVRALLSDHAPIVEAAGKALSGLQHRILLPKEDMQNAIRPLLSELSEADRLTIPMLKAISNLLELLPRSAFNHKFAEKMYEYWGKWLAKAQEEVTLHADGYEQWKSSDSTAICIAIIGLFSKMEDAAQFLTPVVECVIVLESSMSRFLSSPFRTTTVEFLSAYPAEATTLFLSKFDDLAFFNFYKDVLKMPQSEQLRVALLQQAVNIDKCSFQRTLVGWRAEDAATLMAADQVFFQGLAILRVLVENTEGGSAAVADYVPATFAVWEQRTFFIRLAAQRKLPYVSAFDLDSLVALQISYLRAGVNENIDLVMCLLRAFTLVPPVDVAKIFKFYADEVATKYTPASRCAILSRLVDIVGDTSHDPSLRSHAIHKLGIPILAAMMKTDEAPAILGLGDEGLVNKWTRFLRQAANNADELQLSVLQLTVALVRLSTSESASPAVLSQFSEDVKETLLHFAWESACLDSQNLGSKDISVVYSGYVAVAQIMSAFQFCPEDKLLKLYRVLINTHTAEQSQLIRRGISLLQPLMPQFVESTDGSSPEWLKVILKVTADSQSPQTHVQHIWVVITQNADLFYPFRHLLATWMVQSISRALGVVNTQAEVKSLLIDIVELLVTWDERAMTAQRSSSGSQDVVVIPAEAQAAPASGSDVDSAMEIEGIHTASPKRSTGDLQVYTLPKKLQETLTSVLLLSIISTNEVQGNSVSASELSNRCFAVLSSTAILWPGVPLNIVRVDKVLSQCPSEIAPGHPFRSHVNCLKLVTFALKKLPRDVALAQVGLVQTGMVRASLCTHLEVSEQFREVVTALLSMQPHPPSTQQPQSAEVAQLYKFCVQYWEKTLAEYEKNSYVNLRHILKLFSIFHKRNAVVLEDAYMTSLLKIVQKAVKDFTAACGRAGATPQVSAGDAAAETDRIETVLDLCISILLPHLFNADTQFRKPIAQVIAHVAEQVGSAKVLHTMIVFLGVELTIVQKKKPLVPLRDKAALFAKVMSSLVKRFPNDKRTKAGFDSLFHVFDKKVLAQSDAAARLESAFMMGLSSPFFEIREKFFKLYSGPTTGDTLYQCLNYCFSDKFQRWESSKGVFWVRHCLDIVLAGASTSMQICPAPGVHRLPPLMPIVATTAMQAQFKPVPPQATGKAFSERIISRLTSHESWLEQMRDVTTESIVQPLRTLCFVSKELAYKMWVMLFPLLWHVLEDKAKHSIAMTLQQLLTLDFHAEQAMTRPNNVRALVTGISLCAQWMVGPEPTLLYHLAQKHNLWHTAIALLRIQAMRMEAARAEQRGQVDNGGRDGCIDPIQDAIMDLYIRLGETDTWFGLWRLRAKLQPTAQALAFEQQAYWEQAQDNYERVMESALPPNPHPGVRDAEFQLWETHWTRCNEHLGNYEVLVRYAEETKDIDLMLKSAWKLKSWKKLKDTVRKVQAQREPSFDLELAKAYHVIATSDEVNVAVIEQICEEATALALRQWRSLPAIVSHSHVPILEAAQRFVEVQESADIVIALRPSNVQPQPTQDLSNLVEMWRKRLPNEWDDQDVWQNLLMWRLVVFDRIASLNSKTQLPTTDLRVQFVNSEMAWTQNQLATIARKHKLKPLSDRHLLQAQKIPGLQQSEMFSWARETVCGVQELSPDDFKSQLDVINTLNLQLFDNPQRAEIFAYRGKVLHRNGSWEDANKIFSAAITLCEDLGIGWEAWAIYCDDMYKLVIESIRKIQADGNHAKKQKTEAATETNAREWAKSAMTCYLNACRSLAEDDQAKRMVARALLLLANDDGTGEVGMTFMRLAEMIDTPVWKFWIPQLLLSFSRPEAKFVHNILVRLAKYYPQALYYSLRTAYLDIRSGNQHSKLMMQRRSSSASAQPTIAPSEDGPAVSDKVSKRAADGETPGTTSTGKRQRLLSEDITTVEPGATADTQAGDSTTARDSASSQGPHPAAKDKGATASAAASAPAPDDTASSTPKTTFNSASSQPQVVASDLVHVSNVMQTLRMKHTLLAGALENMIEDLVNRFKPTPEEEFLRTTHVLLTECLKYAMTHMDRALHHQGPLPPAFDLDIAVPQQIAVHLRRVLTTFFTPRNTTMAKYRSKFEKDFGQLNKMSLDTCLRRLHEWHRHMTAMIQRMPKNHRLEDFSQFLINFSGSHTEIDLPGEHLARHSFLHQAHTFVRIERFLPAVTVMHKHSAAFRQIIIRGRDGRQYPYLIQQVSTRQARSEERFTHFMQILNVLLAKRKESRKRSLMYHIPRVVSLNTHVRLVQYDASVVSLEDIFQEYCHSNNTTIEAPTMETYNLRRAHLTKCRSLGKPVDDIRKEIFERIRKQVVPSDIFSRFMRATFPDHTDLWMFQRQFTSQLAMTAFASYFLMLSKGAPHTLLFALDTGNVIPWELTVTFNSQGHVVSPEPVPFRLTPNLVNFISPVGITGIFSASLIASAQAIAEPQFRVQHYLGTLFRDEMISWHANHVEPFQKSAIENKTLVSLVDHNSGSAVHRLNKLAVCDGTNNAIDTLIKQATSSKHLSDMSLIWHPWL